MDLNATLIGQFVIFAIFYKIVKKWIWPSFNKILSERQHQITAGLEAAEKGKQALENARAEVEQLIAEARHQVKSMLDHAHIQAESIKEKGKIEAKQLMASAHKQALEDVKLLHAEFLRDASNHYADILSVGFAKVLNEDHDSDVTKKMVHIALDYIETEGIQ